MSLAELLAENYKIHGDYNLDELDLIILWEI